MQLDTHEVEEVCKDLYVRALKILPPDIKAGFARLQQAETHAIGQTILGTMVENIAVAERTNNLLCQDTGIPIYNVTIGRDVVIRRRGSDARDPARLRARDERAFAALVRRAPDHARQRADLLRHPRADHPLSISTIGEETVEIEMIPKGSGSENGSFLQMLIPADGIEAVKRFVIDRVIELGGRVCPPTIVGVGIGGTSDLCMHLAKIAATRPLRSSAVTRRAQRSRPSCREAVNELGIGPQGLGGARPRSPCMSSSPRRTSRRIPSP